MLVRIFLLSMLCFLQVSHCVFKIAFQLSCIVFYKLILLFSCSSYYIQKRIWMGAIIEIYKRGYASLPHIASFDGLGRAPSGGAVKRELLGDSAFCTAPQLRHKAPLIDAIRCCGGRAMAVLCSARGRAYGITSRISILSHSLCWVFWRG